MTHTITRILKGMLVAGVFSSQSWGLSTSETPAPTVDTRLTSAEQQLRSHLPAETANSIWAQIEADQYRIRPQPNPAGTPAANETLYAPNARQAYRTYFEAHGPQLILVGADAEQGDSDAFSLALVSVQQGARSVQPKMRAQHIDPQQENRMVYTREHGVEEWYVNRGRGLEQGFTLHRPIDHQASPALTVQLQASAGWSASQLGEDIRFHQENAQLSYRGLKVWDADQRTLPAQMHALPGGRIRIQVDVRHARYPITIDPVIQNEDKTLKETYTDDRFGYSVAISGDTLVVGAYLDDDNGHDSGAAYVFSRSLGGAENWGKARKLTPSDGAAGDYFGYSVAISSNYLVVGAYGDDDNGSDSGAAYVFHRSLGGIDHWGQEKKLTASDGAADDNFGVSVGISGDDVVVGAYGNNEGGSNAGAAYVFNRVYLAGQPWSQVKKLTASDGAPADYFGWSVSISNDSVVVGAYRNDIHGSDSGAAYVFNRSLGGSENWGQAKILTASDAAAGDFFGYSVAISENSLVVGAYGNDDGGSNSGAAYVFNRDHGGTENWGEIKTLTASDGAGNQFFGISVAISDHNVLVGAYGKPDNGANSGAAYLFHRDQGGAENWGEVKILTASDAAAGDFFGYSVAISENSLVVGAYGNDDDGSASGASYLFNRDHGGAENWGEIKKLTPSGDATGDEFGYSVAISGDNLVVGAYLDGDKGIDSGSAYLFSRNSDGDENWGEVKKLTASDGFGGDFFGESVAISGDNVVVSARSDDDNGSDSGSAYVFHRHHGGSNSWGEIKKITASDGATGDQFGISVAISGDSLVVGAQFDDDNGNNSGAAYVFRRDHGGSDNWGETKKLTASDGAADDWFGSAVAISGDSLVVGAYPDDDNGIGSGSAYVFHRNHGGAENWGEVKKLTASDGAADDNFGSAVAISGDRLVVGAHFDDDKGQNSGSAYVFRRDHGGSNNWGEVKKLIASDGAAFDTFGISVSINGDSLVVGAPWDDDNGDNSGAAYVFKRHHGGSENWGEVKKLTASDGAETDDFGWSVAVSGDSLVVGARLDDDNGIDSGSAYVFNLPIRVLSVRLANDRLDMDHTGAQKGAQLLIAFSSAAYDPLGDLNVDDVSNVLHYALYSPGGDGVIDSALSNGCLLGAQGDDVSLSIDSASYDAASRTIALDVNGGVDLTYGEYSLLVCGSTPSSVSNNFLAPLDGNGDTVGGDDYVLKFELEEESFCFPIKARNGNVAVICL